MGSCQSKQALINSCGLLRQGMELHTSRNILHLHTFCMFSGTFCIHSACMRNLHRSWNVFLKKGPFWETFRPFRAKFWKHTPQIHHFLTLLYFYLRSCDSRTGQKWPWAKFSCNWQKRPHRWKLLRLHWPAWHKGFLVWGPHLPHQVSEGGELRKAVLRLDPLSS